MIISPKRRQNEVGENPTSDLEHIYVGPCGVTRKGKKKNLHAHGTEHHKRTTHKQPKKKRPVTGASFSSMGTSFRRVSNSRRENTVTVCGPACRKRRLTRSETRFGFWVHFQLTRSGALTAVSCADFRSPARPQGPVVVGWIFSRVFFPAI